MLDCKACIHKCIRTILADILPPRPIPQRHGRAFLLPLPNRSTRRAYATEAVISQTPSKHFDRIPRNRKVTNSFERKRDGVARGLQFRKSNLERELRYLKDPLKLADHTRDTLRNGEEKKALETIRAASGDVQCTVSWNHLIDYEMTKGRVNAAVKMYNEVCLRVPETFPA